MERLREMRTGGILSRDDMKTPRCDDLCEMMRPSKKLKFDKPKPKPVMSIKPIEPVEPVDLFFCDISFELGNLGNSDDMSDHEDWGDYEITKICPPAPTHIHFFNFNEGFEDFEELEDLEPREWVDIDFSSVGDKASLETFCKGLKIVRGETSNTYIQVCDGTKITCCLDSAGIKEFLCLKCVELNDPDLPPLLLRSSCDSRFCKHIEKENFNSLMDF